ncbi:cyclin PHO80-like protein, partial [Pyronema domesticum]
VLNTTQVSLNVVLLALLFVHRLKKLNPAVQGRPGSQYRLFTVALMLGNKYLDDNTYTNKTWADVSGISVQEIHIMEVEFLSNMRYSLYVPESEWSSW